MLTSTEARAHARLGDTDRAVEALCRADNERDKAGNAEAGGLFGCTEIGRHCFAAAAHIALRDWNGALQAADTAIAATEQTRPQSDPTARPRLPRSTQQLPVSAPAISTVPLVTSATYSPCLQSSAWTPSPSA